jgi:predicted DNA-binding transcriptional regulator AlpA
MKDEKLSMARLAMAQLSRKDRIALAKEIGLVDDGPGNTQAQAESRLLRRHEVARRLSVSLRTVDNWARQGVLTKRKLPGRLRAAGFSSLEVDRLITVGA